MKWTDYTTKETLKDNDELMILDKDANANKRTLMDKIWDYVVDKMTTAVIAKLETTNKTLIGAVNELNSNPFVKPAKLINYGEIDLGANGCYFLNESFPEIRGSKHIEIAYWTSIIPMSPLSVYAGADGRCYVFGSPNTKVRGLKIYYWK